MVFFPIFQIIIILILLLLFPKSRDKNLTAKKKPVPETKYYETEL